MESLTLELCVAPGDPYDRTLSVLARSGKTLIAARSWRIRESARGGEIILHIERLALRWFQPHLSDPDSFVELLEATGEALSDPF